MDGQTDLLAENPWVPRRKIDVDEYHRMGAAGILTPEDRVELIEGALVPMAPIGVKHAETANALTRLLVLAAGESAIVSAGNPVRLDGYSEPQPDFTLIRPGPGGLRLGRPVRPDDVLLAVEVSETSLRFDRVVKRRLYAHHGIRELWIVDLRAGVVEVFRRPEGGDYHEVTQAGRDATLSPEALPAMRLRVADFLD